MTSSTIALARAAKASPAATLAARLSSKATRSPSTATGRPARVAPARARAGRLRPRPGARIGMAARMTDGSGRSRGPLVHEAGLDQPLDGLAAPVPEGHATDGAGRQDHPPAAGQQVLGDLAARLGAADDQHRPVGELAGAAVVGGVELGDPRRGAGGPAPGPGAGSGRRWRPPRRGPGASPPSVRQGVAVAGGGQPGRPGRPRGPGRRRRAARAAGRPPGRRRRRRAPARRAAGSSSRRC